MECVFSSTPFSLHVINHSQAQHLPTVVHFVHKDRPGTIVDQNVTVISSGLRIKNYISKAIDPK